MKLEQQVVSLDLAKRLKELGVGINKDGDQESLFYWFTHYFNGIELPDTQYVAEKYYDDHHEKVASAFTVAELGEMLKNEEVELPTYLSSTKEWAIVYETTLISGASTEANARAKMLVYLLENNLITPASQDKE